MYMVQTVSILFDQICLKVSILVSNITPVRKAFFFVFFF